MRRSLCIIGGLILTNALLAWAQMMVRWRVVGSFFEVDDRYWLGSLILLVPLVVWGVSSILPGMLPRKSRSRGKTIRNVVLALGALALGANAACQLAKAHTPGQNRHAKRAACDWAAEAIRADYRGPKADAVRFFSAGDYLRSNRPVVDAHTARVAYLLGGRQSNLEAAGLRDIPDYVVGEPGGLDTNWWGVADYELLAAKRFDRREFVIYRRIR